ncbi:MAG: M55 family metallopeptidase, partial [Ruthenibacterium sp.]
FCMNVFISADIEGTCGIAAWSETEPGKPDGDYAYFKTQMSEEVAAACRGAVTAGAARILVKDAHDSARNINPIVLPQEAQINRGWSGDLYSMMSGIQRGEWDAVAFTGYHAAASGTGNPLSHTMSLRVDWLEINGVRASEFTINAYTAGYHGVPV